MLRKILIWLLKLFGLYEDKHDTPTPFRMQTLYEIKPFMQNMRDEYIVYY